MGYLQSHEGLTQCLMFYNIIEASVSLPIFQYCVLKRRRVKRQSGEITLKAPTWELSCHRWCLEVSWQLAHSVSVHVVLMQSVCICVQMCPWCSPGLATCSVFATALAPSPEESLTFQLRFTSPPRPAAAWGLQEFVLGFIRAAKKLSVVKHKSGVLPPGCCFPICFHPSDQFWPKSCRLDLCRPTRGNWFCGNQT